MKERYGMTDMRKQANRMMFNQPEEELIDGDDVGGRGWGGCCWAYCTACCCCCGPHILTGCGCVVVLLLCTSALHLLSLTPV
jgi:hypothetical protein